MFKIDRKLVRLIRTAVTKIVAFSVIASLNWNGLSAVVETVAYYSDTENSNANVYTAGTLDFSLDSSSDFSPSTILPGQSATRTIVFVNSGNLPKYDVTATEFVGEVCDYLTLSADIDGGDVEYSGSLKSFQFGPVLFSDPDAWTFTLSMPSDLPITMQEKTCQFKFVFFGSQERNNLPFGEGFNDTEEISNQITAGFWQTCWIQTTQSDFNAGQKTNVDINTIPGDVILTTVGGGEQIDQQSSYCGDGSSYLIQGLNWGAQTFTAGKTGKLTKVVLRVKKSGSPDAFAVEIRNVVGGKPGSIIYASSTKSASEFSTCYSEEEFVFSTPVDIINGTQYAIVFRDGNSTCTNKYYVSYDGNNYSGGKYNYSSSGGFSWTTSDCSDFWFKTYIKTVDSYKTPGTLISQTFDSGKMTSWQTLYWTETLPDNTDITLEVQLSNDGINWSEWYPVPASSNSPTDLSSLPQSRYIRWKATLSTGDLTQTPDLQEVRTCYLPGGSAFSLDNIKLNEFLPNPNGREYGFDFGQDGDSKPKGEWVEIYNNGTSSIDLAGWYIKDSHCHKIVISALNTNSGSTIIGPKGSGSEWLVVYMNQEVLDNFADKITLYEPFGGKVDSHSYDFLNYCNLQPTPDSSNNLPPGCLLCPFVPGNKTYARIPDGTGPWYDPIPTPGSYNIEEVVEEIIEEEIVEEENVPTFGGGSSGIIIIEPIIGTTIETTTEEVIVDATVTEEIIIDESTTTDEIATDTEITVGTTTEEIVSEPQDAEQPVTEEVIIEEQPPVIEQEIISTDQIEVVEVDIGDGGDGGAADNPAPEETVPLEESPVE